MSLRTRGRSGRRFGCHRSPSSCAPRLATPDRVRTVADRLYFRQLLAGRDFARDDPVARQMVNFAYLIGDRETGDALAVDPAYSVRELVETAAADGMRITGALVTHYHPDHV